MNSEETKALAEEIVRSLLERVGLVVSPAPAVAANPEPIYMTAAGKYAKRVGYGRTTVLKWVRAGMPSVPSGRRGSRQRQSRGRPDWWPATLAELWTPEGSRPM